MPRGSSDTLFLEPNASLGPNSCYILWKSPSRFLTKSLRRPQRAVRLEAYIEEILAQHLGTHPLGTRRPRNPEEIRAWLDSFAQFSDRIPPLPETISRDWIHQEHN